MKQHIMINWVFSMLILKLRKGEEEAQFELISQVNMFSVFSYDVKCKEVCFWV